MTRHKLIGDRIIAFAISIQPFLVVLQTVMIDYLHMNAESTTAYRIVLTAIPMVFAILIALSRNLARVILGYMFWIVLFTFTAIIHPNNIPFLESQGFRFLLPVVLPSFLCLTVVYDFNVIEKTIYYVSWATTALVLLIIYGFFSGIVSFTSYNMAFSFACVLPFVVLYSHRKYYDWIVCFVLFVVVIATGARGPALCMVLYVIIDLFQHKSRWRIIVLVIGVAFVALLPLFLDYLESLGISSRTIEMLLSGEILSNTGRDVIRQYYINELFNHPFLGIGLFGDRMLEDVAYCHNILLEILLDFGIPLGGLLIILGSVKLILIYKRANIYVRGLIIKYFCALVLPFMTSSSYLIDSNFAIFIGICYLFSKKERVRNVILTQG